VTDDWSAGAARDRELAKLDTGVANSARVWNYWLGGKDNFAADREAAQLGTLGAWRCGAAPVAA